jgi:hypothetical protein
MIAPIDERMGLPSASGMERIIACPGSWNLEKNIPETTSVFAESGNKIHAWLAGESSIAVWDEMTEDERGIALACEDQLRSLVDSVFAGTSFDELTVIRERRLEFRTVSGDVLFTGKPDIILSRAENDVVLVVDYKGGRIATDTADTNIQLLALAVLVWGSRCMREGQQVIVAIIQPPVSSTPSVASYSSKGIEAATAMLYDAVLASQSPEAIRTPSEKACRYCKGKSVCPEIQNTLPAVTVAAKSLQGLDSLTMAKLLESCSLAEKAIDAIREESKARLTAGDSIPGWKLKPGSERKKITDVMGVWNRVALLGVGSDEFTSACSITQTALKPIVKKASGKNGKELESTIESLLAGNCETTTSEPSLVRV